MKVTLINPPFVDRKGNITSAVTIPLGVAYLAAYLRDKGISVEIIDAVGEGIDKVQPFREGFLLKGLSFNEIVQRIPQHTDAIGISAIYSTQHNSLIELIRKVREKFPDVPLVMGGDHVTYYYKDFFDAGVDYVILNEGEISLYQLCRYLEGKQKLQKIEGLVYKKGKKLVVNDKKHLIKNLDTLPFPARDLLPLENYSKARMGHAPVNKRFTSIIASRGCPFKCTYCASSLFWKNKWRVRSPKRVVDEMEECIAKYGIREFHFEDDNLTLDKEIAMSLFKEIIKRDLDIEWCAASGLRPENVDRGMLETMKKSGCTHITLAPESGSQRILKEVFNKHIDLNKIKDIVKISNELGIKTAAYILIGVNSETKEDRKLTIKYIKELAIAGLDELGAFPVIPYPNTAIAKEYPPLKELNKWEELTTGKVPYWYPDYKDVKKFKRKLYTTLLAYQLMHHPIKLFNLIRNLILRKQETKTDRVIQNIFKIKGATKK